jgi:arylsulfatase A-like enzyme
MQSGPSFLYLHMMDVHGPYHQREPWYRSADDRLSDMQAAYDSEINYVDQYLERLWSGLAWSDDTIFVLVSDHGEEFEEHGRVGHFTTLYRELGQVAWLVHAPGQGVKAARHAMPVSLVDLVPTVMELAGLAVPTDLAGRSLAATLRNPGSEPDQTRRVLLAHRTERPSTDTRAWRELWSAIAPPWQLIVEGERCELYDLSTDPTQQQNLCESQPEVATRLRAEIDGFQAHPGKVWSSEVEFNLDTELVDQLEALGYVTP